MPHSLQVLMDMKIWVCWYGAKIPISANGCVTGANDEYASTWVTYEEARAAAEEHGYKGVSFRIPKDFGAVDIDHRTMDDPYMQTMLRRFGNTYIEKSFSGNGVHVYFQCNLDALPTFIDKDGKLCMDDRYYIKNPNNHVEVYIGGTTNHFMSVTLDAIRDNPLADCTGAVLTTLKKDMLRKNPVHYSEKRDGYREVFDIVCNLRKAKNGEKFIRLYDKGDITGYGSPSEADAALCALIAFRAGKDGADLIDEVFRTSALYREKWERDDYRAMTITAGIEACHGTFHKSVMPHPNFIRYSEVTGKPSIVCPFLARYVRERLRYVLVRDDARHGILTYVYDSGVYKLYAPEMLKGIIKGYIAEHDEELVAMKAVNEVYNQLLTDLDYIRMDALNTDENIINFRNGLLRLSDMTLLPHSPEVLSTIQIPCDWTGKPSPTTLYDGYIRTLTDGDKAVERLCHEIIGVCLSNVKGWRMKKSPFFYGAGDTGKSQLKSLVERILGKGNFVSIDLKEMEARFGTGVIYGMRLAGSSDMSFLSIDELKTFKKVTGGDSIFAEFKCQQGFEFTYTGMLWFCMNRLPKFGGDDGEWVYDRIMPIECKNVIPKAQQDKTLLDKMYAERDGIVYKAVMALKTVIANGYHFSEPKSVSDVREQYMKENNTVISFFEECMEERQDEKYTDGATTGRIYDVYKAWCRDNNNGYAKTSKEFRETVAAHLGKTFKEISQHGKYGTYYAKFTLTNETKEHYRKAYAFYGEDFLE